MTPEQLVTTVSPLLADIGAAFYFTPATLARGKELGLDGFRFYFLGRGGVLGDVEPAVVTSAFGYFNPDLVTKLWASATAVLAPRAGAREYLACAHAVGRDLFAGVEGLDTFCTTAEAVIAATDPAALALYAGLAAEPLPDDGPARAMQLAATLRELRGSVHLVAVVATGLSPRIAHQVKRPDMVKGFGWAEEVPTTDEHRAQLAEAETLTDTLLRRSYAGIDGATADAFATVVQAMRAALPG